MTHPHPPNEPPTPRGYHSDTSDVDHREPGARGVPVGRTDDHAEARAGGAGTDANTEAQPAPLGPDATVADVARAARSAFFSTDLIQSGPALWPFGRRARERRARNQRAAAEARRRRAQFAAAFDTPPSTVPPRRVGRWPPVDRRANGLVIAGLVGVVLAVIAVAVWGGDSDPQPEPQAASPPAAISSGTSLTRAPDSAPSGTTTAGLSEQPPIPSGGVPPITPQPGTPVDPASIRIVDPPAGDPTPAELATPEGAMRAWLARLCPFDYRQPFGTAERRARAAMTDAGWSTVDPSNDEQARASWDKTVAARESGRCVEPAVQVSPEAPRTPTSAIVIGSVARVVTAEGQRPYVEQLFEVRIVRRGGDGLWRVDLPTEGG